MVLQVHQLAYLATLHLFVKHIKQERVIYLDKSAAADVFDCGDIIRHGDSGLSYNQFNYLSDLSGDLRQPNVTPMSPRVLSQVSSRPLQGQVTWSQSIVS